MDSNIIKNYNQIDNINLEKLVNTKCNIHLDRERFKLNLRKQSTLNNIIDKKLKKNIFTNNSNCNNNNNKSNEIGCLTNLKERKLFIKSTINKIFNLNELSLIIEKQNINTNFNSPTEFCPLIINYLIYENLDMIVYNMTVNEICNINNVYNNQNLQELCAKYNENISNFINFYHNEIKQGLDSNLLDNELCKTIINITISIIAFYTEILFDSSTDFINEQTIYNYSYLKKILYNNVFFNNLYSFLDIYIDIANITYPKNNYNEFIVIISDKKYLHIITNLLKNVINEVSIINNINTNNEYKMNLFNILDAIYWLLGSIVAEDIKFHQFFLETMSFTEINVLANRFISNLFDNNIVNISNGNYSHIKSLLFSIYPNLMFFISVVYCNIILSENDFKLYCKDLINKLFFITKYCINDYIINSNTNINTNDIKNYTILLINCLFTKKSLFTSVLYNLKDIIYLIKTLLDLTPVEDIENYCSLLTALKYIIINVDKNDKNDDNKSNSDNDNIDFNIMNDYEEQELDIDIDIENNTNKINKENFCSKEIENNYKIEIINNIIESNLLDELITYNQRVYIEYNCINKLLDANKNNLLSNENNVNKNDIENTIHKILISTTIKNLDLKQNDLKSLSHNTLESLKKSRNYYLFSIIKYLSLIKVITKYFSKEQSLILYNEYFCKIIIKLYTDINKYNVKTLIIKIIYNSLTNGSHYNIFKKLNQIKFIYDNNTLVMLEDFIQKNEVFLKNKKIIDDNSKNVIIESFNFIIIFGKLTYILLQICDNITRFSNPIKKTIYDSCFNNVFNDLSYFNNIMVSNLYSKLVSNYFYLDDELYNEFYELSN